MNEKRRNRGSALVAFTLACALGVTGTIVGGAVSALIEEARDKEKKKAAVEEVITEPGTDVPKLYVIPDVHIVEPYDDVNGDPNGP